MRLLYRKPGETWEEAEIARDRFIADVSRRLAGFAKVPSGFFEGESLALWLSDWLYLCQTEESANALPKRSTFVEIRHTASTLHQQLADLHRCLTAAEVDPSADVVASEVLGYLRPPELASVLETLRALDCALGPVTDIFPGPRPRSGRPEGDKRYPNIQVLVYGLEIAARVNGGKFTLNKRDRKGTLIEAVDWLRGYCEGVPEWQVLTATLPPTNKHPVSIYERALQEGRKEARLLRKIRQNAGYHPKIEMVFSG